MAAWYSKKWMIVFLHAAVWVFLFSLPQLLRMITEGTPRAADSQFYLRYIMDATWIGLFYLNMYVLIPRFIFTRRYLPYGILLTGLLAWMVTQSWLIFGVIKNSQHFNWAWNILVTFIIFLLITASSLALRLISDRIDTDRRNKERENENLKTELSLLRSQVSPHFMFNVLNNMVALARKKSDLLEPSLIKLSSLMRYMLYETDEEKVPLDREVEYLESYIDLQKQRFGKNVRVNSNFERVNSHHYIEPMLLIPFVENAFKHGAGMIEDAFIDIHLHTDNNTLQFSVKNKYNDSQVKDKSSGIGLANVKRRLKILYSGAHQLDIHKTEKEFVVSLKLKLHS